MIKQIFEAIGDINRKKEITILLVEQNAMLALSIADRGYVLQTGRIVHQGEADILALNPEVQGAYLEGFQAAH